MITETIRAEECYYGKPYWQTFAGKAVHAKVECPYLQRSRSGIALLTGPIDWKVNPPCAFCNVKA